MGIQGLLPLLKPVTKTHHISFYKNRRVAVDGYSWLHKAVYGCCVDMTNGKDNLQWVSYCIFLIDMLLSFDIQVHMVFDGANLPAKKITDETRAAKRAAALSTGLQLLASQNADKMAAARSFLSNAVDVTPSMAALLIKILRLTRPTVQCTVAPYEADAQLAYLCSARLVDAVISEDSDTIPYGCTEIIFKLKNDGSCESIVLSDIFSSAYPGLDMRGFNQHMMQALCVAAGCDYLASLKGCGVKNSYKLIAKHGSATRLLVALRQSGLLPVSANIGSSRIGGPSEQCGYEIAFHKAMATFNHQVVFDVQLRMTRHLTPISRSAMPLCIQLLWDAATCNIDHSLSSELRSHAAQAPLKTCSPLCVPTVPLSSPTEPYPWSTFSFLGDVLCAEVGCAIADGHMDPSTLQFFDLPDISAQMIATIGLRNHSADSVSVTAIPVSLKGACTVGLARSDPTAQPRISAVSVAVRSGNLADAPHVHGEAPLHARSQDNMDDCALQESSRARGGVQLKRKQAENFLPGILDIACSSIFLSSRVAHERTFLTRVDTVYNASDAGIDIKRRHLDGPRSGPDNSSPVTARTPFNAVSSSGGLARSQNFLYSILHSPIDKRHPSPVEITISKQAPVRIPTVQYSHPVTCKESLRLLMLRNREEANARICFTASSSSSLPLDCSHGGVGPSNSPPMKQVADISALRAGDSDHSWSAVSNLGALDESYRTAFYSMGHNDGSTKPASSPHPESVDSPRLVQKRTHSEQSSLRSPTRLRGCTRSRLTPELKTKHEKKCFYEDSFSPPVPVLHRQLQRRYSSLSVVPSASLPESLRSSPLCPELQSSSVDQRLDSRGCRGSDGCQMGITIAARPTSHRDKRVDEMERNQEALIANLPVMSAIDKSAASALHRRTRESTKSGDTITPKRVIRAYNKEIVMGT